MPGACRSQAGWPAAWMGGWTMKLAIVAASILLALAGRASAQPGMTPPVADSEEPPPPTRVMPASALDLEPAPAPTRVTALPAGERLSEEHALALSLGGTALSWGLMIGAMVIPDDGSGVTALMGTAGAVGSVFAPSFGHWYADTYATRGLMLRLGGMAGALAGALVALAEDPISFGHDDPPTAPNDPVIGPAIAIVGAGMFVAGTIDDIVTAPRRVRRMNREREAGVSLAPMVTQRSAGLALGGRC
jgi:hypothetical protein